MKDSNKNLTKRIAISMLAQIVSLLVSFLLNLIVPRFIDELQYAYWQTFLLYVNYVGVLHFGLLDGIVLRYAQYDLEDLDKPLMRSQLQILGLFSCILAGIFAVIAGFQNGSVTRSIIVLVGIGIITKNLFTYTSYTFQITNRIREYAILVIFQRIAYGIASLLLIVFGIKGFIWFCLADLLGDITGIGIGLRYNKSLFIGKASKFTSALAELRKNIGAGINLMVATWSSIMLVGLAKMIIQWKWDDLVFGKISFAFSVTNLFLAFVTAVSVVLFPSLKRMDEGRLPELYSTIRSVISPLLLLAMLFYFPGCWILERWLPSYTPSLEYLGILLPIIVFSSNVSLLTDNYLKAYRKEKDMLVINLCSIALAVVGFICFAYFFESIEMLLIWIVVAMIFRSMVSEVVLTRIMNTCISKEIWSEIILVVCFVVFVRFMPMRIAFCAYLAAAIVCVVLNNKSLQLIKGRFLKDM